MIVASVIIPGTDRSSPRCCTTNVWPIPAMARMAANGSVDSSALLLTLPEATPIPLHLTVDPWWDLESLLTYGPDFKRFLPIQIDGRAPLDVAGMTRRMEDVLERTLRRL